MTTRMMIALMQAKYVKRTDKHGCKRYPAGGEDIYRLCSALGELTLIIEDNTRYFPKSTKQKIAQQMAVL